MIKQSEFNIEQTKGATAALSVLRFSLEDVRQHGGGKQTITLDEAISLVDLVQTKINSRKG